MPKQILTCRVLEHTDVRGKVLQYLIISNDAEEYAICVGQKTFDACTRMENEKPQGKLELTTNEETPKAVTNGNKGQASNNDNKS